MDVVLLAVQAVPPEQPKWTDVAGFVATSAGVVVTLVAVVVALFGPRWHAKRAQPKLSLSVEPPGIEWTVGEIFAIEPMTLLLHNAEGRDTARDVEVFAYATSHDEYDDGMPRIDVAADTDPLVFENPLGSNPVRTVSSIPSGFSRKAYWAVVGAPKAVAAVFGYESDGRTGGLGAAVALDRYGRTDVPWLEFEATYLVDLIVTGSNFDALYFSGIFESYMAKPEDAPAGFGYEWRERPKRVARKDWKPPFPRG